MSNKNVIETLSHYFAKCDDNYLIFGGLATSLVLGKQGIQFRETHDADIIVVCQIDNEPFGKALSRLLLDGGYKNAYVNEKRTAYRFIDSCSPFFPKEVELFTSDADSALTISRHIQKIEMIYNDEKLSAIVLDTDVYFFAKSHQITIDNLRVVDAIGLIALKSFAYINNFELWKQGKVHSDAYKKHMRDVVQLMATLKESEIAEVQMPKAISDACLLFYNIFKESKRVYDSYNIAIEFRDMLAYYKAMFVRK